MCTLSLIYLDYIVKCRKKSFCFTLIYLWKYGHLSATKIHNSSLFSLPSCFLDASFACLLNFTSIWWLPFRNYICYLHWNLPPGILSDYPNSKPWMGLLTWRAELERKQKRDSGLFTISHDQSSFKPIKLPFLVIFNIPALLVGELYSFLAEC